MLCTSRMHKGSHGKSKENLREEMYKARIGFIQNQLTIIHSIMQF